MANVPRTCELAGQLTILESEARSKLKANPALADRYAFCAGEFLKARHLHVDHCPICQAAEAQEAA